MHLPSNFVGSFVENFVDKAYDKVGLQRYKAWVIKGQV